ncbi:phosphotyrosine-specific ptp2-like protein, partial [Coemansia spiralis]
WQVEAYHPDDASVIARRFRLSRPTVTQATMCVTHLQYVGWPDHGVPENPLGVLRLIHLARRAQGEDESSAGRIPMVVHCSAGCGRTGAFCVIDTIIQLDVADAGRDTPVPDTTLSPGTTTATGRHSTFTGMVPKALQSRGPSEAPVASGESPVQGWSPADAERSGDRQTLTQWTEKPPAELRDDLVFMVVSRFRELRITMVQTLRQFVFCHEALAWVALNAGPRPIDHVIDRRLVAEWNRMNHTELSEADCADITFLLRGRQEMVQAMLNSDIGGSTKGGSGNPAMAASSAAVSAGRASIDVVSGGGVPSDDFPMTSGPPAVKRSNTVGPVRRGFLASLFRPVEPATGGSGTGAGKSAQEQRLKPQTRVGAKLSSMAPAHAPIAEEEPTAVAPADAGHIAPTTPSPALSPASSRLLFGSTRVNGARPRSSVLLAPLVSSATSAIQESPDCDYFGLASATIESSARLASADSPVSPGGGWPRNGGTCSPHHNRHHHRRMASRGDNTPPTSPAYVGGTALASPSAR